MKYIIREVMKYSTLSLSSEIVCVKYRGFSVPLTVCIFPPLSVLADTRSGLLATNYPKGRVPGNL